MPFIVARTVVSFLRRRAYTKKHGDRAAEQRYERAAIHYSITSSARASSRQGLAGSGTQLHCARFQSARDRTCRPYAKIVQLYRSRTNRSSTAAKAFYPCIFFSRI